MNYFAAAITVTVHLIDIRSRHFACLACVVIPGFAHHVTERGSGRARTLIGDEGHLDRAHHQAPPQAAQTRIKTVRAGQCE
jgi:hypothetical protein